MPKNAGIRRLLGAATKLDRSNRTDHDLLLQFVADGDDSAFEALVKRHTNLVLGVCRRTLSNRQDAEDACQAVFLILAKNANSRRWQSSIANWLYTTARKVAHNARRALERKVNLERRLNVPDRKSLLDQISGRELLAALDDELARLPAIYREALVLYHLEGLSRSELATRLGVGHGTIKIRLERGRKKLADALTKRGIDLGAGLMAIAVTRSAEAFSPRLVDSIMATIAGSPSASVSAIANGIAVNGISLKAKMLALAAVAAAMTGFGAALLPAVATPPDAKPQPSKPTAALPALDQKPQPPRLDRFGDPLPEEALARFGTVRFRQGGHLTQNIRYSPDGKTIAVAGWGRSLGLWDAASGKELSQLTVDAAALARFPLGYCISYCIAYSPDGNLLAEGVIQGDVRIWDVRTGKLKLAFKAHPQSTWGVVFTHDGRTVVSAGGESVVRFWDVESGKETAALDQHSDGSIRAIAISNDGKLLAAAGYDKLIRIWKIDTRTFLKELQFPDSPRAPVPATLSFAPDGKQIAAAASGQCAVWDVASGEPVRKLHDEQTAVSSVQFAPNGKWLAAGCKDGAIRLYDRTTWKEIRRWNTQCLNVRNLAFSSDSKTIASNSQQESSVRFWDVKTGKDRNPSEVHRSFIQELRLSPNGRSLLGLERESRVIRWDLATTKPEESICFRADPSYPRAALSADGALLAWGSEGDKSIHIMDLKTRKHACEPLRLDKVGSRNNTFDPPDAWLRFSPDGKIVAIANSERLIFWHWQTERDPKPLTDSAKLCDKSLFTPDSKKFIAGDIGQPSRLHVWEVDTGEKRVAPIKGGFSEPLAISPDARWAVRTSFAQLPAGGHIDVIDVEQLSIVRQITLDREGGSALAFSPNGRILAFGEDDFHCYSSDVRLIEFATGQRIATFKGHHSGVSTFRFSPDGRTLYSAGCDSTILKWDATARHGKGRSTVNPEAAWDALAQEASKAYPASWDLVDEPKETVELLRRRINPAQKLALTDVQSIVNLLDAEKFSAREKASKDLHALGYSAEPILRKLLETEKRAEVKQRLQAILERLDNEFVRIRRALQVLETINNGDAKQLLGQLAAGAPGSMLTNEAETVLKRMAK